ncbi:MAG: right-handed parallel beta-helix repeat-containing protein, partial [Acidobacteriia bacterium]|nr:right-handed parallel beta-helix repeat-containing protein [Terriglobia bacterium]
THYVDCASGSDRNSGGSPSAAWKTVEKASATTFAPGDALLFHRGGRCRGSLWPKGSGEDGRPIRAGAYGEGPLPIIDAGSGEAAIKLFDQQYWEIEKLETVGGNPYGVWIGASPGSRPLRHFVLRGLVVHDVGGTPKRKASGLVVITGADGVALEQILVDGITAYRTSQWAGIYVSGSRTRARNVTVRNSIVHDVDGDGIVLFQAENGRIEKSAAWRTGLQDRETIGTPNAIWTWTCRNCIVENTEGFWIDSPGVDGGVYDIDWGNDDNVVQYNYAHDAQGYCAAVFGAGKKITTNSAIRYNVCVNNGRSPKLARRQGDVYTSTWEGGALDGVAIEHNTIIWNPPIDAPAIQMSGTEFSGARPNVVADNLIYSYVSSLVRSAAPVKFERNVYWRPGGAPAQWFYGGQEYAGAARWREISPADLFIDPGLSWNLHPRASGAGAVGAGIGASSARKAPAGLWRSGKWTLALLAGKAEPDARSQLVFVQAALAQYQDGGLEAAIVAEGGGNLPYDWNLGAVRVVRDTGLGRAAGTGAALWLISPAGEIVRTWQGFARPSELGLALKHYLGAAPGNPGLEIGRGSLP